MILEFHRRNGTFVEALLDGSIIAQYVRDPGGWSVRWAHIVWGQPAAHERHDSEESARRSIEDWVRGLDIIPWD